MLNKMKKLNLLLILILNLILLIKFNLALWKGKNLNVSTFTNGFGDQTVLLNYRLGNGHDITKFSKEGM